MSASLWHTSQYELCSKTDQLNVFFRCKKVQENKSLPSSSFSFREAESWLSTKRRQTSSWNNAVVRRTTGKGGENIQRSDLGRPSRGLERVELEDVVIGRSGEVQLLIGRRDAVVAGAFEAQRALEVQELAHEVEVGGDVGLLLFDDVVGVVHGQVQLLHEVRHRYRHRAADTGQAVHQDAAFLTSSFVWNEQKEKRQVRIEENMVHFNIAIIQTANANANTSFYMKVKLRQTF